MTDTRLNYVETRPDVLTDFAYPPPAFVADGSCIYYALGPMPAIVETTYTGFVIILSRF
jgi:hypothetical protein